MTKFVLLASASVLAFGSFAQAADLTKKATPAAPQAEHVAGSGWTGCYLGLNGGFASQANKTEYLGTTNEGSNSASGGAFGGQVGCDIQSGNVVFGVQGLVDWTQLSGHNSYTDNEGGVLSIDASWFAMATARLGYTIQPETLVYIKGGAAWIENKYQDAWNGDGSTTPPFTAHTATASKILTGWVIGGGLEHKLTPNISMFVEYDYMDFGSNSVELTDGTADGTWKNTYTNHVNVGLAGINYRF